MDSLGGLRPGYSWCDKCSFVIKTEGHELRCRVQIKRVARGGWSKQRKKAWLNDTVLRIDVQIGAVLTGVSDHDLETFVAERVSGEGQVQYWNSVEDRSDLCVPSGTSISSISTAFECSYRGKFREKFLQHLFPENWREIIERVRVDPPG